MTLLLLIFRISGIGQKFDGVVQSTMKQIIALLLVDVKEPCQSIQLKILLLKRKNSLSRPQLVDSHYSSDVFIGQWAVIFGWDNESSLIPLKLLSKLMLIHYQ